MPDVLEQNIEKLALCKIVIWGAKMYIVCLNVTLKKRSQKGLGKTVFYMREYFTTRFASTPFMLFSKSVPFSTLLIFFWSSL